MGRNIIILLAVIIVTVGFYFYINGGYLFFIGLSSKKPMVETDTPSMADGVERGGQQPINQHESYVEYSPEAFEAARDKKRVYFFHAKWCPTCKAVNIVFSEKSNEIPEDVVVFKTDYDIQSKL